LIEHHQIPTKRNSNFNLAKLHPQTTSPHRGKPGKPTQPSNNPTPRQVDSWTFHLPTKRKQKRSTLVGGFNPYEKLVVEPTHMKNTSQIGYISSPRDRDENQKYLSCHHLEHVGEVRKVLFLLFW